MMSVGLPQSASREEWYLTAGAEVLTFGDYDIDIGDLSLEEARLLTDFAPIDNSWGRLANYSDPKGFANDYRPDSLTDPTVFNFIEGLSAGTGNDLGDVFRNRPAYQRAEIVAIQILGWKLQDLEFALQQVFDGTRDSLLRQPPGEIWPEPLINSVFLVFQLMTNLVSLRDPGVLELKNGICRLNQNYLRH